MWQLNFEDILNYYIKVFYTMTDCYMSMPVYYRTYIDFGSGTPVNSTCDMLLYMYGRSVFSHIGPLLQTYLLNYTVWMILLNCDHCYQLDIGCQESLKEGLVAEDQI